MTADDHCPFCRFAAGEASPFNTRDDIVYQDDDVIAFISPRWWPNNPGNAIVIPRRHFATIATLPDDRLARIAVVGKCRRRDDGRLRLRRHVVAPAQRAGWRPGRVPFPLACLAALVRRQALPKPRCPSFRDERRAAAVCRPIEDGHRSHRQVGALLAAPCGPQDHHRARQLHSAGQPMGAAGSAPTTPHRCVASDGWRNVRKNIPAPPRLGYDGGAR